ADQYVLAGTSIGAVLVAGLRVGHVIEPAGGRQVIVRIEQVVAPAAIHVVAARATNDPVIAVIAKQDVIAVCMCRAIGNALGRWRRTAGHEDSLVLVEVQEELSNGYSRLTLIERSD